MSGAPARGTVPRRQRRHHHHHHHHHHQKPQKQPREEQREEEQQQEEPEEKRPKVNPIFLWASQREQKIVEVRCEDYDKRNRIKLTKTAQGWRSIPRTASNMYSIGLGMNTLAEAKKTVLASLQHNVAKDVTANDGVGRKSIHGETRKNCGRLRDYSFSADSLRTGSKIEKNWKEKHREVRSSDDDDDDETEEEEEEEDEDEEENEEEEEEEENWFERNLTTRGEKNGRTNLERLQKDKLLQPRVVLEQLHFSQLPESAHQRILQQKRGRHRDEEESKGHNQHDTTNEVKPLPEKEKRRRTNKAGIQDILNMIDATASPVLATDTPSADLPVDSTKTYEVLTENLRGNKSIETNASKDSKITESIDVPTKIKNQSRTKAAVSSYQNENIRNSENVVDDSVEIHEEKILSSCEIDIDERKPQVEEDVVVVSLKNKSDEIKQLCKVAEADGGLSNRSKCRSNSISKWHQNLTANSVSSEVEEERPDEPGEAMQIDYSDSSKILDALRNTPGLSVSVTRTHTPESAKNVIVPSTRPSSKASSSSRSPDSQAECVERILKNSIPDSASVSGGFTESRTTTGSPRNLPGLSIIIPSYRYRNPSSHATTTHSTSPNVKGHRVESPESTVNFSKSEAYTEESKLNGYPRATEDEDRDMEVDEVDDDCDSQVLEDLRRQKADAMAYDANEGDYYHGQNVEGNQENSKISVETTRSQGSSTPHWISSSRSSEAQAKCKYQDLEHFDEQVLEELRSRGTVVSPQPSGIPCSPASRRPSSAYLERLLPSPPCSVSCSEDAKNDLTLKGILASPTRADAKDAKDYERTKEGLSNRCDQVPGDHHRPDGRPDYSKEEGSSSTRKGNRAFQERLNVHNQELKNSGRPMSSGDIHSTYFMTDRATPKRPMSAEWSIGRQKNHSTNHQKPRAKIRTHSMDHQEVCATSTSIDKLVDPASQLRELIETSGHLIPDPLLVPRDYLPGLAAAPATEIPKLLSSRPELRLPEALTRPDLLRDPDLLVISLAHLQHVLDHGEGPVSRTRQSHPRTTNGTNKGSGYANYGPRSVAQMRPKLSCKPIGTLMPSPIDLSSSRRASPYPPLLRVRSGLLKQEPEVSSTASSPDDSQLWHPLFGSQKRQQQHMQYQHQHQHQHHQQSQQQHQHQHQHQHPLWHRTTLAS